MCQLGIMMKLKNWGCGPIEPQDPDSSVAVRLRWSGCGGLLRSIQSCRASLAALCQLSPGLGPPHLKDDIKIDRMMCPAAVSTK